MWESMKGSVQVVTVTLACHVIGSYPGASDDAGSIQYRGGSGRGIVDRFRRKEET